VTAAVRWERSAATRAGRRRRRAFARTDFRAVDQLLARANSLMASSDPRRPALLYDRGTSLDTLGRVADADAMLAQAVEAAHATGDTRTEWRARIDRVFTQIETDPAALTVPDQARLAREALRALEPLGDDRGLARAWMVAALVEDRRGRAAKKEQAAEQALRHARRSGIYREEAWGLWWLADAILTGPTPVAAGTARCQQLLRERPGALRVGDVGVLGTLALFQAMQGHFERGRQLIAQGRELMESLGHTTPLVATMCWRGELELLAGNLAAAEAALDEANQHLTADNLETKATIAGLLARTMLRQGRHDEAEQLANTVRAGAPPDSRPAQARWCSLMAAVHTARGRSGEAVALATHASRLLRPTDLLPLHTDVLTDLASALAARGDTVNATQAAEQALALYTEKGNTVATRQAGNTVTALSAGMQLQTTGGEQA